MKSALKDIKVIDLSRVVAGPLSGSTLGDLGADVIKVEGPNNHDEVRSWYNPEHEEISLYYMAVNRNKRAITIDLKTDEGKEIVKKLIKDADVVIENFKTGTMDRLGLGYEVLKKINPKIILCSITGYGQDGPYNNLPGYDFLAQAQSGAMSVTGPQEGDPYKTGIAMADIMASLYATISVLAALQARKHTNRGQHCDISLLDTSIATTLNIATEYLNTEKLPERYGNEHPNLVPYQSFKTKDEAIIIAIGNDHHFTVLSKLLNLDYLSNDERYKTVSARSRNRDTLIPVIQNKLLEEPAKYWVDLFQKNNIASGPINTMDKVFKDPQVIAREMVTKVKHPILKSVKLLSSPIKLSHTPTKINKHPPQPGEHTVEILKSLNYEEEQIKRYYESEII